MKILSVRTENIMRCKLAEVSFEGDKVVLGGMNGQGKTSFATSIWMAFGGKDAIPEEPVTEGEDVGTVEVVLDGDFVLTRRIYPNRETILELRDKEGGKYKKPQELLDAFNLKFGFWPQDFIMMKPDKQAELLRTLVGLDFSAIDRKIESITEKRRDVGRDKKQLEGQLAGLPQHEGVGTQEVSIAAMMDEVQAAYGVQKLFAAAEKSEADLLESAAKHRQRADILEAEMKKHRADALELTAQAVEVSKSREKLVVPDIAALQAKLGTAEGLNDKIRANAKRSEVQQDLNKKTVEWEDFTKDIQDLEAKKEKSLLETKFPVTGLGFDQRGVTFQSIPFEQASTAQQWEVAVGIGFALNPELKLVYIQYGPLLDENTIKRINEMTTEKGGQLMVEMVGDGEAVTVMFQDGVGVNKKQKVKTDEKGTALPEVRASA